MPTRSSHGGSRSGALRRCASLALIAASQGAPVAGVVHVSGLGRPLGQVLREQPADVPQQLAMLFVPNRTFLRSMADFDPPAAIRAVRQPVLIVQGETDLQASIADAERLHAARPDARLVLIPAVNHVLKHMTDHTMAGQMASYQDPSVPIVPAVVAAIADWIKALAARPPSGSRSPGH